MLIVEKRYSRKRYKDANDDWSFDTIYSDGMEGCKKREDDYEKEMKRKDDGVYEYKVRRSG